MAKIENDAQFRSVLDSLDERQQRLVAAQFVASVQSLSDDPRVAQVVMVARDGDADEESLSAAYKKAKSASLDAHTRCGEEGEWIGQAAYFVARSAEASVEPRVRTHGKGVGWKAAMSARMARTCLAVDGDSDDSHDRESHAQYDILNRFLQE